MPERLRYFTIGNMLVVPLVKAMGKRISALAEYVSYSKEKGLLFWTNIGMTYKASFI